MVPAAHPHPEIPKVPPPGSTFQFVRISIVLVQGLLASLVCNFRFFFSGIVYSVSPQLWQIDSFFRGFVQ